MIDISMLEFILKVIIYLCEKNECLKKQKLRLMILVNLD